MATEVVEVATVASNAITAGTAKGSLATVGTSLANAGSSLVSAGGSLVNVGTATKAFVVFHPISMAAVGGFILGMGVYYALTKKSKEKEEPLLVEPIVA